MKYTVRIDDRFYNVRIDDLQSSPIIANVDGVEIEVWTEDAPVAGRKTIKHLDKKVNETSTIKQPIMQQNGGKRITAPIPGVVVSILVKKEDQVEIGQELCIIEAMKMRNAIRSPRSGKIKDVHVLPGQTVNHNDGLIEFYE
jgi:glutaconyl-CoA/methylmalonyl-CoA decarboxylase subunit gamma